MSAEAGCAGVVPATAPGYDGPTAGRFGGRRTGLGRVLPTAEVGYAGAQLGGWLSGGEIAHRTGAGRPEATIHQTSSASAPYFAADAGSPKTRSNAHVNAMAYRKKKARSLATAAMITVAMTVAAMLAKQQQDSEA